MANQSTVELRMRVWYRLCQENSDQYAGAASTFFWMTTLTDSVEKVWGEDISIPYPELNVYCFFKQFDHSS
jgi:hypothetical protein